MVYFRIKTKGFNVNRYKFWFTIYDVSYILFIVKSLNDFNLNNKIMVIIYNMWIYNLLYNIFVNTIVIVDS